MGTQPNTEDSWSRQYFFTLTEYQHDVNDEWFSDTLATLRPAGVLIVPTLQKAFNKHGEEIPLPEYAQVDDLFAWRLNDD